MIKKKIGVIGCGKWGAKVINELKSIANIKFIYNSKDNYKIFEPNIDWVFVLTPDKTHYKIVKFFINKKINVFCEKPLSLKITEAKKLVTLSNSNNVKLYINDIENFKNKKIKVNKLINHIIRTKKDDITSNSLLYRLAYHDFYLLSKYIYLDKIKLIKSKKINKKKLNFEIILKNNQVFNFYYDINRNPAEHIINKTKFHIYNINPIKKMLMSILYKSHTSFKKNNQDALNCIKLITKVKNNI
jgi:hypothetical protein